MRVALFALTALAAASASAAKPDAIVKSPLVGDVQQCRRITQGDARLACYDRTVGALLAADARGDITVVDRQGLREARRSLFGFSIPKLPFFSSSKDKDVQDEPKTLVSTLAGFRDLGNGYYRFSIKDPESTWESVEAGNVFDTKPGDKVTFNRAAFGSYFVQIGQQQWFRAHRVR